jgi:hypothetical protein
MKRTRLNRIALGLTIPVAALAVGASVGTAATPKNTVVAATTGKWVMYDKNTCK